MWKMKTYKWEQKESFWKTMTAQKNCDSFKEQRTRREYSYDISLCECGKRVTRIHKNKGEKSPKSYRIVRRKKWKQSEYQRKEARVCWFDCLSVYLFVCFCMTAKTCILHSLRKYLCLICNWFAKEKKSNKKQLISQSKHIQRVQSVNTNWLARADNRCIFTVKNNWFVTIAGKIHWWTKEFRWIMIMNVMMMMINDVFNTSLKTANLSKKTSSNSNTF